MVGLPFGKRVLTSTSQALCWHANAKVKAGKKFNDALCETMVILQRSGYNIAPICFSYLSKPQFEDSYQTYVNSQGKAVSTGLGEKASLGG